MESILVLIGLGLGALAVVGPQVGVRPLPGKEGYLLLAGFVCVILALVIAARGQRKRLGG